MKVGLLTSEKISSPQSPLVSLNNYFLSKGISSQIISPWGINPDIFLLRNYDIVIVRILERQYLWLAQYLEEMGIKLINSHKALSLSSNKLISDEIMKQSGLKVPRTVFSLKEKILENVDGYMFPALVKPLYGRSKGIIYTKSVENLKNLRKKWIYLQKFIPHTDGVIRIYKIGKVVKSFFHPNEGKIREISVPNETMERALHCFDRMEMEIGGMDLLEGEDGYYALEVNDFPEGIKLSTIFLAIGAALAYIYGNFIAGAILVQLINIVDGVDGEIARIKHLGSPYGEIIDSLSDRVVEIVLCLAIGYGVWHTRGSVLGWAFSLIGIIGFLGGNYLTELAGARAGREILQKSWKELKRLIKFRLNHRSNQLFIIFVLSLLGRPELALLIIGIISVFYSALRFYQMLPHLKKTSQEG